VKEDYEYIKLWGSMRNAEVEEGICDFKVNDVEKYF